MKITYTSDEKLGAYVFDNRIGAVTGNVGEADGAIKRGDLPKAASRVSVVYDTNKCQGEVLNALKVVKVNHAGSEMGIESVQFSVYPFVAEPVPDDLPKSTTLPLADYEDKGDAVKKGEIKEDGSVDVTYTANYQGTGINVPIENAPYKYVEISTATEGNNGVQISLQDIEGREIGISYGAGVQTYTIPDDRILGRIVINAQDASSDKPKVITLNYIKLGQSVNMDLSAFKPSNAKSSVLNGDRTFTATYAYNTNYPGSYIEIPEKYQDCKCFVVRAINKQGEHIIGTQMVVQDGAGNDIAVQYPGSWADYTATFNIPADKTAAKIIIHPQDAYKDESNVVDESDKEHTIYYVKAIYK